MRPIASVVIPTHNRCPLLLRGLDALARQTAAFDEFEVIVVADGCSDGTVELARARPAPFELRFVEQPASGPSAARNAGAACARGALLIFVDDDVEPHPGFIAAHLAAHRDADRDGRAQVVIGYYPTRISLQHGHFASVLAEWWERMFRTMAAPDHVFGYTDLLTGNLSLPADLFRKLGGLDRALRCHEDYEFGLRLLAAGAVFRYSAEAWGWHYERSDFDRSLRRKFDEGHADVQIGRRHPALISQLPLSRPLCGDWQRLAWAAFAVPWAARPLTALGLALLRRAERRDRLRAWDRWCNLLLGYWYWRGVAADLGDLANLKRFRAGDLAVVGGAVPLVMGPAERPEDASDERRYAARAYNAAANF